MWPSIPVSNRKHPLHITSFRPHMRAIIRYSTLRFCLFTGWSLVTGQKSPWFTGDNWLCLADAAGFSATPWSVIFVFLYNKLENPFIKPSLKILIWNRWASHIKHSWPAHSFFGTPLGTKRCPGNQISHTPVYVWLCNEGSVACVCAKWLPIL